MYTLCADVMECRLHCCFVVLSVLFMCPFVFLFSLMNEDGETII